MPNVQTDARVFKGNSKYGAIFQRVLGVNCKRLQRARWKGKEEKEEATMKNKTKIKGGCRQWSGKDEKLETRYISLFNEIGNSVVSKWRTGKLAG